MQVQTMNKSLKKMPTCVTHARKFKPRTYILTR